MTTWNFSKKATRVTGQALEDGVDRLTALEDGISVVEDAKHISCVGPHSFPNNLGILELDASIMDGPRHESGAVMALQGVRNPIRVARRVLEHTPHAMLAGDGAARFARDQGFKILKRLPVASKSLQSLKKDKQARWLKSKFDRRQAQGITDTVTQLVRDREGRLAAGCSTSGYPFSLPGRVGDSPVIGGGIYVDQEVGAAGATGEGEEILKFCMTFDVVARMRAGRSPQQAVEDVIRDYRRKRGPTFKSAIGLIALDARGRQGSIFFGGLKTNQLIVHSWRQGRAENKAAKRVFWKT